MLQGVRLQQAMGRNGQHLVATVGADDSGDTVPEEHNDDYITAFDDVSGEELDPRAVNAARQEDIEYYCSTGVYRKVPLDECYARTGKAPIQCRWIDINNGGKSAPIYRSRLAAKHFADSNIEDLFAATPPVETLRAILSTIATGKREQVLMIGGVSRAYFTQMSERTCTSR